MKKHFSMLIFVITAICFSGSAFALVLTPVDREIQYSREATQNQWKVLNDGQWHPKFGYIEVHEIDKALVLQFDLNAYPGEVFGNAEIGFFITGVFQMKKTRIASRYYEADDLITSAAEGEPENVSAAQEHMYAGDVLLEPVFEINTPDLEANEEWDFNGTPIEVKYNITDLMNNRTHNIVNINLRFAGSYEDGWDGNVFITPDGHSNEHFARFSASETNSGFRPYLTLEQGPVGNIAGSVITLVTGQTSGIKGASVTIMEKERKTGTDGNGDYVFNNVSVGTWTLVIKKPGFETLTIQNIIVSDGQTTDVVDAQMDFDTRWDMNNDGKKGLPEAIDALQTAADLR
ncbi:MAG: carboxypeptidase regulatory-like domain-containing protein [Deltaproteobacteria bacterium]|nr:carboxypeptidase regulatory-like domain-containing protein [Deltaproteobacteria bacterium]